MPDSAPYAEVSYWLESAGPIRPRPALEGTVKADVAILGAGYTGLWTAYELLRREPSLKVAVVEAEVAGFGASGRNGGWCSPELNVSLPVLAARFGRERARELQLAMYATVDEVGRVIREEEIDADFDKDGLLFVARGENQLPALAETYQGYADAGFGDRWERLDPAALAARVRVAGAVGGLYSPECAVVHPGRLVRGLAQSVERRGGHLYERSRVLEVKGRSPPLLRTAKGSVQADALVLAGEAYLTRLPGYRRRLLPLYSLIVLTEPLPPERLAKIGWRRRYCLASMRLTVDYLSRTRDGRILFGGRGAPYNFGSAIRPETERHAATHAELRRFLVDWFPSLAGVRFTHAWGGVLGMPRDWIPEIGYDRHTGIAYAYGYTGHGVATANLAGRTLADLLTGRDTELTRLPLVGHRAPNWVPEPLRWLGVRYVQTGVKRWDEKGARRGHQPRPNLAVRLARH